MLARVRELKEGQFKEVEILKDVEKAEAVVMEKKRELSEVRQGVSSRKHALYNQSYLEFKQQTPKLGKREREERRTHKLFSMLSNSVSKMRYDSPGGPSGSNR